MADQAAPEDHVTRIPLLASARRAGHAVWLERQLYEVVGAWASDAPEPAATVAFAVQAERHAQRAGDWYERLPELRELPAAELVVPASGSVALVDALGVLTTTAERLAALVDVVLPALGAAYDAVLAQLSPVADGPTMRSLRRMVAELDEERAALGELWTSAIGPSGAVAPAATGSPAVAGPALPLLGDADPLPIE